MQQQDAADLEHISEDAQGCPIGVAAWVDFPEIDLIDELRAPQALIVDHSARMWARRQAAPAT